MKVRNMTNPRSGRPVANQFIVNTTEGVYFQSYDSVIAFIDNMGNTFLDANTWDYSVTTGKYRNEFLGEGIATTRTKIENGTYTLTTLN